MATYTNRNGVAISAAEAVNEQWAGRAVQDGVSGVGVLVDVIAKVVVNENADVQKVLVHSRSGKTT